MEISFLLIILVVSGFQTNYAQENTTTEVEHQSDLLEADVVDMGGMVDSETDIKDRLMSFFNGTEKINFASDARINLNGQVVRCWFVFLGTQLAS